ncbi:uncharacterized protein BX663DRAFT_481821 [Cokeromyces recurvatus]|uniref:uncharacterized protein n=1 Tax=Cokeromyces recurvatus TaxID=90255 RepID=UPI002220737E|nr:uncharacterized protein BX663DRAFT_481821 [Cokeromyces recurvatus]KAI7907491.1 hypothetical protein BX663DRAFT_481821 [Cokeromyces recurvatus]
MRLFTSKIKGFKKLGRLLTTSGSKKGRNIISFQHRSYCMLLRQFHMQLTEIVHNSLIYFLEQTSYHLKWRIVQQKNFCALNTTSWIKLDTALTFSKELALFGSILAESCKWNRERWGLLSKLFSSSRQELHLFLLLEDDAAEVLVWRLLFALLFTVITAGESFLLVALCTLACETLVLSG